MWSLEHDIEEGLLSHTDAGWRDASQSFCALVGYNSRSERFHSGDVHFFLHRCHSSPHLIAPVSIFSNRLGGGAKSKMWGVPTRQNIYSGMSKKGPFDCASYKVSGSYKVDNFRIIAQGSSYVHLTALDEKKHPCCIRNAIL